MSGIAGVYRLDDQLVDPVDLTKMVDVMAWRGPDGADIWYQAGIGLGHRMLWVTLESLLEKLPLANEAGNLIITADARIDNRTDLMGVLGYRERAAEEVTDSQLILAAYEKWGEDCPEKLLGDFAFAIWDSDQDKLFCARDYFGAKPFFYYYGVGEQFVFASEIRAILSLPDVPRCLNEVRIADFLNKQFEDKEITFYKDIVRLPPAMAMTVNRHGVRRWQYWEPDLTCEIKLADDEAYAAAFREIFTEAVRCRLRSAYPVGSTLSGGLDSSSVASVASQILAESGKQRLRTFSAVFPRLAKVDPRIDERLYINSVLEAGQFEPYFVLADRLSPLVDSFWQVDEPIPGINLYMDDAFFRAANQQGVRVLLTGHDGDSIVSHGYERLAELARTLKWKTLFNESAALAKGFNVRQRSLVWNQAFKPLLPQALTNLWRRRSRHSRSVEEIDPLINRQFAVKVDLTARRQSASDGHFNAGDGMREAHGQAITSGLLQYGTEILEKMAAPFGIEPRHPFFDKRLVDFCVALPLEQKLQNGWTRSILRRAMANYLPPEVQWRRGKGNLSANFKSGLLAKERATLDSIVFEKCTSIEKYIDIVTLQEMYAKYASKPLRRDGEAIDVNLAVILTLWLQQANFAA